MSMRVKKFCVCCSLIIHITYPNLHTAYLHSIHATACKFCPNLIRYSKTGVCQFILCSYADTQGSPSHDESSSKRYQNTCGNLQCVEAFNSETSYKESKTMKVQYALFLFFMLLFYKMLFYSSVL